MRLVVGQVWTVCVKRVGVGGCLVKSPGVSFNVNFLSLTRCLSRCGTLIIILKTFEMIMSVWPAKLQWRKQKEGGEKEERERLRSETKRTNTCIP